ncbi:MAG: DNA cytosine methyltransferase [Paludibacter sp.]|nr:DNA cytosine methyltransferase [Paludibacter sp.]
MPNVFIPAENEQIIDYKAIDFFCGGGGMTCGLRQAGINVIAGVDFDKDAKETYEFNNPGSTFVLADVNELKEEYFEDNFQVTRNDDNLILVGCSPCQFYSIINAPKVKAKKSKDLLLQFQRFIDYYNPGYVLVENVPGIMTNKDTVLPEFLQFLENKHYKTIMKVINMKDYGVPQSRRRFSLIATRLNKEISLPEKDEEIKRLCDCLGEENGFPEIPAGHNDPTDFAHSVAGLQEINKKRLAKTDKNGGTRIAWKDDPELQLPCYIGRDNSFKDVYGRMFWERPSSTITTKFFNISNGRFAHPFEDRAISIREGAVLQSFPKDYVFKTASIATAAKLIGNAVPPEYAKRVGQKIINHLSDGTI